MCIDHVWQVGSGRAASDRLGSARVWSFELCCARAGLVGTAVAMRAKAFGFKVLFYDPSTPEGVDKSLGKRHIHIYSAEPSTV